MTLPATAREVLRGLYLHFNQRYACLTEVTIAEAEPSGGRPYAVDRRCDLLLVSKTERINVEVKVTRADFLADVADPVKQAAWQRHTHRWAYAVPAGLVTPDEVPDGWGLLYVGDKAVRPGLPAKVEWARRAPKHPEHVPADLPPRVQYALLHRLARAEAQAKGHGWGVEQGESESDLRARVDRLERDVTVAQNRADRADRRARDWHRRYSALRPPSCGTCGLPLRASKDRYSSAGWAHDAEHEVVCQPLRTAAEAARVAALPDEDRGWQQGRYLRVPEPYPQDVPLDTDVAVSA